jgi:hypothetical protein
VNVLKRALRLVEGQVKNTASNSGAAAISSRSWNATPGLSRRPHFHDRRDVNGHEPPNVRRDDPAQSTDSTTDSTSEFEHALVRPDVGEKSRRLSGATLEEVRRAMSTGVVADDIQGEPSSQDRVADGIQLRIHASARCGQVAAE